MLTRAKWEGVLKQCAPNNFLELCETVAKDRKKKGNECLNSSSTVGI